MPFDLVCTKNGLAHVVIVFGEVDVATAPRLRQQLRECLEDGALPLVVDMRMTSFCDSQCLAVLIGTHKRTDHMRLVIEDDQRIREVFRICWVGSGARDPARPWPCPDHMTGTIATSAALLGERRWTDEHMTDHALGSGSS